MKPELLEIPFDHFQRYAAAASVIESLGNEAATVLEVGANRQRLLGGFLPNHRILFSDLEPQDNDDGLFVRADATALPFEDDAFDCVVSLDVMEHIPVDLRTKAVAEMARVAKRIAVIACPLDRPWVHAAELEANALWRQFQGTDYQWLEEHKEFGLVDPGSVEGVLSAGGWEVLRFGQGDARLWASLMGAHFLKEAVSELAPLVAAADRLYNQRVFAGDRSEQAYREFFVAVRNERDRDAVRASLPLVGTSDPVSVQLLGSLANSVKDVVRRTRHAEESWAATAELVRKLEAKSMEADREVVRWEARCQAAAEMEASLRVQIEAALEREDHLRQLIDAATEREAASSTREVYMREQIETARAQYVEAVNERATTLQQYRDLAAEHQRLIDGFRRRWRLVLAAAAVLLATTVVMVAILVLRGGA